jgi:hypothetical protein
VKAIFDTIDEELRATKQSFKKRNRRRISL